MVVLNDLGLFLEIIGFAIFVAVPIHKTISGFILLESSPDPKGVKPFLEKHPNLENLLRVLGIVIILAGLMMQFTFFNFQKKLLLLVII